MEWLRNAAATAQTKAAEAAKQAQERLKETGVVDSLAPLANAASEKIHGANTLVSGLQSSLESSFNSQVGGAGKSGREGDVSFDAVGPPWVTAHLGLKPFEADMKASMLKIAEGTDEEVKSRFKENVADEDFDFDFLEPSSTARALAALEADAKLKAARHRLVPSKIKENDFWRSYFWKCDMIIQSYLKMSDKAKRPSPGGVDRYPDATDNIDFGSHEHGAGDFASDDVLNASPSAIKSSELSWEEEMAKELEGIEATTAKPACDSASPHAVASSSGEEPKPVEDFDEEDFEKQLGL